MKISLRVLQATFVTLLIISFLLHLFNRLLLMSISCGLPSELQILTTLAAVLFSLVSAVGIVSTTILGWRKENRDLRVHKKELERRDLEIEKLTREIQRLTRKDTVDDAILESTSSEPSVQGSLPSTSVPRVESPSSALSAEEDHDRKTN